MALIRIPDVGQSRIVTIPADSEAWATGGFNLVTFEMSFATSCTRSLSEQPVEHKSSSRAARILPTSRFLYEDRDHGICDPAIIEECHWAFEWFEGG